MNNLSAVFSNNINKDLNDVSLFFRKDRLVLMYSMYYFDRIQCTLFVNDEKGNSVEQYPIEDFKLKDIDKISKWFSKIDMTKIRKKYMNVKKGGTKQ